MNMKKRTIIFALLFAAGCQKQAENPVASAESEAVAEEVVSTRIVLRMSRSGATEVLDVVEQPGLMPASNVLAGNYVYEVRDGSRVVAVESFVDPFEERAAFEGEGVAEHSHLETDSATIVVRVPGVATRGRSLSVQIHRVTRDPGSEFIDAAALENLVRTGVLARAGGIEAAELAPRLTNVRRLSLHVREMAR